MYCLFAHPLSPGFNLRSLRADPDEGPTDPSAPPLLARSPGGLEWRSGSMFVLHTSTSFHPAKCSVRPTVIFRPRYCLPKIMKPSRKRTLGQTIGFGSFYLRQSMRFLVLPSLLQIFIYHHIIDLTLKPHMGHFDLVFLTYAYWIPMSVPTDEGFYTETFLQKRPSAGHCVRTNSAREQKPDTFDGRRMRGRQVGRSL